MLTIAIPTYNRNALLLDTVSRLLPQLTGDCRCIILDNHSPTPVEETLRPILANYPATACTIVRHRINIGADANILRCFEICETPWLWVLGDDDEVLPQAVSIILQTIADDPELTYANFASEFHDRAQCFVTVGLEEFATKIDNFGNAMFISASFYNCHKVRAHLALAFHYSYSCAAHLLLVILSLGENGRCLFSDQRIVRWEPPPSERAYSISSVAVSRTTLLELPFPPLVRISLARAIRATAYSLRALTIDLYRSAKRTGDLETSRYLYDQMAYRLYYFDRGISMRLKIWLFRLPLRFPQLYERVSRWTEKCTGRRLFPLVETIGSKRSRRGN